jgi:Leucine-rich repeat (LRR) protein
MLDSSNYVRYRVHDCTREKFSTTVDKNNGSSVQAKRFRHLSLDGQSDKKLDTYVDLASIRSIIVSNRSSKSVHLFAPPKQTLKISSLICSSQMKTLSSRFLKFQLSNYSARHEAHWRSVPLEVPKSLQSSIGELPSSIGMLPFLQVLNVTKTQITSLPSEITQLKRLRILRASSKKQDSFHHKN